MKETQKGGWVHYDDYALLKSEVERLTSDLQMEKENEDRLVREWQKANNEVERLRAFTTRTIIPNEELQTQIERLTKAGDAMANTLRDGGIIVCGYSLADEWLKAKLNTDYACLKAQIERLTKAGDAIYQSFDQFGQVDAMTLKRWQDAKEGKDTQ